METIDQIATKANEKMASQKQIYSSALQKFNISKKDNAPKEKQIELFEDFRDKAITFFNCVENCISSTEISGAFKSEHWSKDLTDTAVNVLESIAIFYEKYNREAKELGLNILQQRSS